MPPTDGPLDRRAFLALCGAVGAWPLAGPEALGATPSSPMTAAGAGDDPPITRETVRAAAALIGLEWTDPEIDLMLEGLVSRREDYAALRAASPPNAVVPALGFDPLLPGRRVPDARRPLRPGALPEVARPARLEDAAFWTIPELAALLRSGAATSVELTEMYLDRLERHGPTLECVVTLLPERALEAARRADREIAAGEWRGPLHGIPWGAKDLLAARGAPTTWGARPYADQVLDEDASVVRRLDEAGAVLVAKLTLGALAWGDVWFGGTTRNPWNLDQGSSGSSAGSAAATVAGLVGFAIGSETLGSIVSPCTRCGATGLRPTFGRVGRHGAMALSWSMDKLGPIARSVEDCALVFAAIEGDDGLDPAARDAPFGWDPDAPLEGIRVGWLASAFEGDEETTPFDAAALSVLRGLGADLVEVSLPEEPAAGPMGIVLSVEAAAAFDALTRSNRDDEMVRQIADAWPNVFRQSRLVPAVEYVQANRLRTRLMEAMQAALADVDVFVTPSFADGLLGITNLTGHPCVVLPHGFREDGTPVSLSFVGNLYRDDDALIVAHRYQAATDFHRRRPPGF